MKTARFVVQAALLCVALSILAGAGVLIAEFVHKMKQVEQVLPAVRI